MTGTQAGAPPDLLTGGAPVPGPEFARISALLHERTGIELRPGKETLVSGRLDRRLRHHGLTSFVEYVQVLEQDEAEVEQLVDLLTTHETSFFREPAHFERLRAIAAGHPPGAGPLRVWSAAASTGEEAWSAAMTLADVLGPDGAWDVLGTDVSAAVLATARRGVYPLEAAAQVPAETLQAHCLRGRDEYTGSFAVAGHLRAHVRFERANLLHLPADLGPFDVVLLRNVMIYFSPATKQALVSQVEGLLRPGGHLCVGHAESLNGLRTGLTLVGPSVYLAGGGDA